MGEALRIAIASDLHSELPNPNLFKDCDALIIDGDLCPDWRLPVSEVVIGQVKWLETHFNPWAASCGFKKDKVFVIPGNHDISFQENLHLVKDTMYGNVIINQSFELGSAKFWGTPYTFKPPHYGKHWAFGLSEESLWDNYLMIPQNTDYLCSHQPPKFGLSVGFNGRGEMCDFGSESFRKFLIEKSKEYMIKEIMVGHTHENGGLSLPWTYHDAAGFKKRTMLRSVCLIDDGFCRNRTPYVLEV